MSRKESKDLKQGRTIMMKMIKTTKTFDREANGPRRSPFYSCLLAVSLVAPILGGCQDGKKQDQAPPSGDLPLDTQVIENWKNSEVNIIRKESDQKGDERISSVVDEDLSTVLKHCGVGDLSRKDVPIFQSQMQYEYVKEINAGIAKAYVPLTATLNLVGTLNTTTLDVGVTVGTVSGTSLLGPVTDVKAILDRAEELAKRFRGPAISGMEPPGVKTGEQWAGLVCNITASSLVSKRGGYETESLLSPQFLPNVSPLASRERLEREIPNFRSFGPITVTVKKSNHPALKGRETIVGSVFLERIDPKQRKNQIVGEKNLGVEGDSAFRITNRFINEEITLALGFHLWTEYYIDHKTNKFSAVVAHVGDEDIMYFVDKYQGDGGGDSKVSIPKYNPQIERLINNSCISCHNEFQKATISLANAPLVKAAGPKIRDAILNGSMPKNERLKDEVKEMVKRWAENGYQ